MKYLLFYRWHGISEREIHADSFEEAEEKSGRADAYA